MEKLIIIDTDFLSAFLKINKLDQVFTALETKELIIVGAVLHELEQAPVYDKLLERLSDQENKIIVKKTEKITIRGFGKGESESIELAKKTNALLLTNDQKAVRFAESEGITIMDIPIFLLYCKSKTFLSKEEIRQIIEDLKEKDYYEFNREVKEMLLE